MNDRYFRNIVYLADRGGTGFWRHTQQMMAINCIAQELHLQLDCTQTPVLDQNFYKGMTSVTVQRWLSDNHEHIFNKFLKPLCDANSAFLVYAIDDAMHYTTIPLYNRGRAAFANDKIQANIKSMLNNADFVVVTTQHLKEYYHEMYDVPLENIIAVPNFLPQWWFGGTYDAEKKVKQFSDNKARPRIGIISSLSHFNVDKVRVDKEGNAVKPHKEKQKCKNEAGEDIEVEVEVWKTYDGKVVPFEETEQITDDFDDIADCIRSTVKDFQYVCLGYCPPQIEDLRQQGLIEFHTGVPILNYPQKVNSLNLQAILAPIKKMEFNYCKSHIKYMEAAALGVPLFATNCLPYDRVMPERQLFNDQNDLKDKLIKFKQSSLGLYRKMIEGQWQWLNAKHHEGDFDINTYWMEPNLKIWIDIYRLRQKTLPVQFGVFTDSYELRQKMLKEKTIFKNDNILITK